MKIPSVFLKNNVPIEFSVANIDTSKLILNYLVCMDQETFDLTKCIVYVNEKPVNFIKGDWATPSYFHVNGIPNKISSHIIEPLAKITFTLVIDCKKEDEDKYSDFTFHLHLSLERDPANHSAKEKGYNLTRR